MTSITFNGIVSGVSLAPNECTTIVRDRYRDGREDKINARFVISDLENLYADEIKQI